MSDVHVLVGLNETKGGLVIRKPKNEEPKSPRMGVSKLGLDKLAAIKERERKEKEIAAARKRQAEGDDDDYEEENDDGRFVKKGVKRDRGYRETWQETPSHTGGVSEEARKRGDERKGKVDRGLAAASRGDKDGSSDYYREWKRPDYRRDRRRDRDGDDRHRRRRDDRDGRHEKIPELISCGPLFYFQ